MSADEADRLEDGRTRGRSPTVRIDDVPLRGRLARPSARWWSTRARSRSSPTTTEIVYLVRQPREAVGGAACWSCPRASSTSRASRRSSARSASSPRRSASPPRRWRELKRFYTSPGFVARGGHDLPGDGASHDVDARARPGGADRDRPVAARRPRRGDRRVPRLEVPDRAAAVRRPPPPAATHAGCTGRAGRAAAPGPNPGAWPWPLRPDRRRARDRRRFEALVLDFLAYLEFERGLSRNTLDAYRTDLLQYGAFLAGATVTRPTAEGGDVADFLADLATGSGDGRAPCSAATINRKAACLRSFYRHLRREELVDDDPTAALAPPGEEPQAAAGAELRRGEEAARQRQGRGPDRAARPGAARGDVRLRPARLGGGRARGRRRRPAARLRPPARQGLEGAHRAAAARGGRGGSSATCARDARSWSERSRSRSCSSTSAAGR